MIIGSTSYLYAKGRWHRYSEHRNDSGTVELELTPLEAGDPALARIAAHVAPRVEPDWRAPFVERTRMLDSILSPDALKRIRRDDAGREGA